MRSNAIKKSFLFLICTLIVMLLVACGNQTYINVVRETSLKGESHTIGQLIDSIKGKKGEVNWIITEQKDQPNLVNVKVVINPGNKAKGRIVKMQYLLDMDKDKVKLVSKEVDGKPLSPLAWALQISRIISQSSRG